MGSRITSRHARIIGGVCALIIVGVCSYFLLRDPGSAKDDFTLLLVFNGEYAKQAENLLGSIRINAPELLANISVCTSDDSSKNFAIKHGLDWFEMQTITEYGDYYSQAMFKMTERKLECILQVLQKHKNVLYVDTDIVLLENPMQYMRASADINIQNDQCYKPYTDRNLCTGFMYVKPTADTIELINQAKSMLRDNNYSICDQNALNQYLRSAKNVGDLKIHRLDECEFPNGCRYFDHIDPTCKREQAKIVHGNCMVGLDSKLDRFAEHGLIFSK